MRRDFGPQKNRVGRAVVDRDQSHAETVTATFVDDGDPSSTEGIGKGCPTPHHGANPKLLSSRIVDFLYETSVDSHINQSRGRSQPARMNPDTPPITERTPSLDRDGRPAYRVAPTEWSASTTVVAAVSEVVEVDPLADDGLLYDALDPEALDCLFADGADGTSRTSGRVVFSLRGCEVEVHATGAIVVLGPEGHDEAGPSTAQSA